MTEANPEDLLPWHRPLAMQVAAAWSQNRMPHALLVHGQAGLGKRRFAFWLARARLCETQAVSPAICGHCNGCRLTAAGSHPDLLAVGPEEGKQQISVDAIRAASGWLAMTSHQQGWKIAIVDPAQQMTAAAANSLLKTLEEPPQRSLLLLVASSLHGMPATIRSRCQRLAMSRPESKVALAWLKTEMGEEPLPQLLEFAGGAPLRALELKTGFAKLDEEMRGSLGDYFAGRTDVTRVAQFWAKEALPERLLWLDLWLTSLARETLAGNGEFVTFPAVPVPLPSSGLPLNISHLYRLTDRIRDLKAQLLRTALNRELAVEQLLVEFTMVFARRRSA